MRGIHRRAEVSARMCCCRSGRLPLGSEVVEGPGGLADGVADGQASGEQAANEEGRGADLAGEREGLAGQRDRPGRVTDKNTVGYGDGELNGGVREVAAGPREISRLFGQAAGVFERAGSVR